MSREEELAKAREAMRSVQPTPPEPYKENTEMSNNSIPAQQPMQQPMQQPAQSNNNITVLDFLNAANAPKFVDKNWASKGKTVQIKKFTKGDLDKISSPLLRKTMRLDLNAAAGKGQQAMNMDVSMDVFTEMEKIMVEIALSSYLDGKNKPVISREYIDNVMTDEDFKELVGIIREVNPKAMMATLDTPEETEATKK